MKRNWSSEELRFIANDYFRSCVRDESQPRVKELAQLLGLARSDFSKLFLRQVGEPPSVFLRRWQIARAKWSLRKTEMSLNQIAYTYGFGTRATFFKSFKRVTGLTPSAYRKGSR